MFAVCGAGPTQLLEVMVGGSGSGHLFLYFSLHQFPSRSRWTTRPVVHVVDIDSGGFDVVNGVGMEDINVPQIHSSAVGKFQKYATPAPITNVRVSGESAGPMHLERTAACSGPFEPLDTTLRCLKQASRPQNTAKLSKPHLHVAFPPSNPLKPTTKINNRNLAYPLNSQTFVLGANIRRENEQRTNLVPVMPNYTCVPYDSSISDFCTS